MYHINSPDNFMLIVLIFFSVIAVRYFIGAGVFYAYFYIIKLEKYKNERLSKSKPSVNQMLKEVLWSVTSSVVFAIAGAVVFWMWQAGYTAIYSDFGKYGSWYLPVSLILAMLIHETYYYWVHRWMHRPKVFRIVHKVHHDSVSPTPWTAFSFHPWESLLEAIILPVILLIVPMHPAVLGLYLLIMTISSVINHLDIEIYPDKMRNSRVGQMLIGATHHHLHHKEFRTNYGLYFTFWDKWMKTENKIGAKG